MKSVLYKIDLGKKAADVITNEHKCINSDGVYDVLYENNIQNEVPHIRKLYMSLNSKLERVT